MLKSFLESLECSKNPLLGPNIKGLKLIGILQPETGLTKYLQNLIHFLAIIFVLSQYIELWINRSDLTQALRNLSISMLSTICVIKVCTFISWSDDWKEIFSSISKIEIKQMTANHKRTTNIINQYTKYSRFLTFSYWTLVMATVLAVVLAPLVRYISDGDLRQRIHEKREPYPEIMNSWLPVDKSSLYGYCVYTTEHVLITFYGGGIIAAYDSMAVVLMTFFYGQLKMLKGNCSRIFGDGRRRLSDEEAVNRIRECHEHHVLLVKYSNMLDSLLSPVMFIYVVICSLMICSSVIQLTRKGTTGMNKIWISEYVVALIVQLFLYCWHSNNVLYMSMEVDQGLYSSAWWSTNPRVRKSILLLGGQLRKTIVFRAGPFTTLSAAAFVMILRGSYSYYTLLG